MTAHPAEIQAGGRYWSWATSARASPLGLTASRVIPLTPWADRSPIGVQPPDALHAYTVDSHAASSTPPGVQAKSWTPGISRATRVVSPVARSYLMIHDSTRETRAVYATAFAFGILASP